MKNIFLKGAALVISAGCMFPATGSASVIFSFGSTIPTGGTISGGNTLASMSLNEFVLNGVTYQNGVGGATVSVTEAYSNGKLTYTGNVSDGSDFTALTGTFLTINETASFPASYPGTVNLYSSVTSITATTALTSDLGLTGTNIPVSVINVPQTNLSVSTTATGTGTSTQSVTSYADTITLTTPEPSSFAMLAFGLFSAGIFLMRRNKLVLSPSLK